MWRRVLLLMVLAGVIAVAACGPAPEDPASGIPSRSPVPVSPTATPTETGTPTPTPVQTRSATVELMDSFGNLLGGVRIVSSTTSVVLAESVTDQQGVAVLDVVDGSWLTAMRTGTAGAAIFSVVVPETPLVRMRSVSIRKECACPDVAVQVYGGTPGEELYARVDWNIHPAFGYASMDGSPTFLSVSTVADSYQDDGLITVRAMEGPGPLVPKLGVAVDLLPGSVGTITLATDSSPAISVALTGTAQCMHSSVGAGYARKGSTVGPGLFVPPDPGPVTTFRPPGAALGDQLWTYYACQQPGAHPTYTLRRRPMPDPSPVVDRTLRVPFIFDPQFSFTSSGEPSLTWLAGDPGTTDAVTGVVTWVDNAEHLNVWEFRTPPPAPGTASLRLPALPPDVAGYFGGTFRAASFHYVDADYAQGYVDAWRFHARPRPPTADVQYSSVHLCLPIWMSF